MENCAEHPESQSTLEKQYTLKQFLGKGGFGTVHLAQRKTDNLMVAVKEIRKKSTLQKILPTEVVVMQELKNVKGVIKILDFIDSKQNYYIIMEHFNCKDMFDYVSEKGPLKEDLARHFFKQVLDTICICHKRGILHRDIKDENLLVNVDTLEIKLIDFGLSTYLHSGRYKEFGGTMVYAPPEWFTNRRYTGDGITVWSLGTLLYTMLYAFNPYRNPQEIVEAKLRWFFHPEISTKAKNLISLCLKPDQDTRISLEKVSTHPWLCYNPSQ